MRDVGGISKRNKGVVNRQSRTIARSSGQRVSARRKSAQRSEVGGMPEIRERTGRRLRSRVVMETKKMRAVVSVKSREVITVGRFWRDDAAKAGGGGWNSGGWVRPHRDGGRWQAAAVDRCRTG